MTNFYARDVVLKLAPAGSNTLTATTVFDTAFVTGAVTVATAKSFELNEGEQSFDQVDYLGTDSSGYQNMGKVNKPRTASEATFTVDAEDISTLHALIYDSSTAAGGTHTTYTSGNATRKEVDVLVNIDNSTDECSFVLKRAQQVGPMTKVTGADGNIEYEFKLKCLSRDVLGPQWKN